MGCCALGWIAIQWEQAWRIVPVVSGYGKSALPTSRSFSITRLPGGMRIRLTLKPGQRGTKRLVARYGERLVCVRYRYDEERKRRYKTVELIVDEVEWEPRAQRIPGDRVVGVRVGYEEEELRGRVKRAGGRWNRRRRVWELQYGLVVELGLEGRMVADEGIQG